MRSVLYAWNSFAMVCALKVSRCSVCTLAAMPYMMRSTAEATQLGAEARLKRCRRTGEPRMCLVAQQKPLQLLPTAKRELALLQ